MYEIIYEDEDDEKKEENDDDEVYERIKEEEFCKIKRIENWIIMENIWYNWKNVEYQIIIFHLVCKMIHLIDLYKVMWNVSKYLKSIISLYSLVPYVFQSYRRYLT